MEIQRALFEQEVIAYYRRSQDKKGQKHSIQAQQAGVHEFCKTNNLQVIAEYEDTASGKIDDREGLLKAVAHAKKLRIPLVVLRVCRLGRKLSTLASYFEDNRLKIYVCDLGLQADFLTTMILSSVSAASIRTLSKRTKEGLRAAKAKGISLGNPRRMETATPKANEAWRAKGRLTVDKYGTLIVSLRDSGLSWQKVADNLNEMQVPTPSGKSRLWRLSSVQNIYKKVKGSTSPEK